jgi:hypothetical protein
VCRRGAAAQHGRADQLPASPLPGMPPGEGIVGNGDGRGAMGTAAGIDEVTGAGAAD